MEEEDVNVSSDMRITFHVCDVSRIKESGEWVRELLEEEYSRWVIENVQRLGGLVGVSFGGLEDRVVELFREIEKKDRRKRKRKRRD